jgi:precorrin-6B C5,15-methyltransferase / cobalt-precorrin-6B C5,C15-methyltransferase
LIPVAVIGIGLSPEDLTERHLQIIKAADVLVGGKRLLEYFKDSMACKKIIDKHLTATVDFIKTQMDRRSVVVLASGDPLFFGIGPILVKALGPENVVIYPNISSVAAAFARIKEPWSKARVVSLHGRKSEKALFKALDEEDVVAVLTDPSKNPAWLAQRLVEENLADFNICVLESLGQAEEHIDWYPPARAAEMTFAEPNLVIIKRRFEGLAAKQRLHLGMPDHCYVHEKGLITKSEVRAIALAKLRLMPDHILWDLGAGSGSVSIEAALLVNRGSVFAVEKNPARVKQIEINQTRFKIENLEIYQAEVPDGLADLPRPDRIFIGGGGRTLAAIISAAASYLKPDGRIVVNTVLLPNIQIAADALTALGFKTEVVQVQVSRSRKMPWAARLEAQNPVWIVTGSRDKEGGSRKAEGGMIKVKG